MTAGCTEAVLQAAQELSTLITSFSPLLSTSACGRSLVAGAIAGIIWAGPSPQRRLWNSLSSCFNKTPLLAAADSVQHNVKSGQHGSLEAHVNQTQGADTVLCRWVVVCRLYR